MKSRTEAYPGIFPRIEGLEVPRLLFPKPQVFSGFFPFSTSGVQILFWSLQLISCLSGMSPLPLSNHRTKSKIKKWMNESRRATQLPATVVYTKWLCMIPPLNNLFLSHTLHTVSFHPRWDTESEKRPRSERVRNLMRSFVLFLLLAISIAVIESISFLRCTCFKKTDLLLVENSMKPKQEH